MNSIEMRSSLLARNTIMNFFGQLIPLIIGVSTIPFVIRSLGSDSFGILGLAWAVLGYFSLFDLGLGRATTQFVAGALGKGETEKLPHLIWTSLGIHLLLGLMGGLLLAILTPLLVERVFNIPPALIADTKNTFFILAISVPVILTSTVLRGVLEASQRFDLVNAVKVPSGSLIFLLPVAGILIGFGLPGIVFFLMMARLGAALAYLILCLKIFPILKKSFSFDSKIIRPLLSYGGWVTVSNVISPVLVYLDRFVIGSLISMSAVAYYTASYEVITRLWILPSSLTSTLFPAFSTIGTTSKEILLDFYTRSVKYLLLIMGLLVIVLILFAEDILHLWLGGEFAKKSTPVFQILAVGVLFNSLAQIPFALLQGLRRPDLTAKFHLLEVLLYVPLVWFLVKSTGVAGGALAWTLRVMLDALLLFWASWKLYDMNPRVLAEHGILRGIGALALLAGGLATSLLLNWTLLMQSAITAILIVLFGLTSWRYVLNTRDREFMVSIARKFSKMIKRKY